MLDLTLALDKWVWTLWKEMAAGKSNLRREADLPKMLNQYLQGDTEVSTQQVIQAMDRTRKLNLGHALWHRPRRVQLCHQAS